MEPKSLGDDLALGFLVRYSPGVKNRLGLEIPDLGEYVRRYLTVPNRAISKIDFGLGAACVTLAKLTA